ncbi:DUF4326 domain-containing protein [Streptomyces sp. NPDC002519]
MTTTHPRRKQRRRTKGWRAPANSTYVGRGSKWGNPYTITRQGAFHTVTDSSTDGVIYSSGSDIDARRVAVSWYRVWLDGQRDLRAAARQQLAGRDLLCWCPLPEPGEPDHCHAAVLIDLVNQPPA